MSQTIEQRLAVLERDNVEMKREIATLAGQFEFISSQLRSVQLYMHNRFDQIDQRFEQVDTQFEKVNKEFRNVRGEISGLREHVDKQIDSLRRDFPKMAADAMREVLAERDRRS